MQPVARPTQSFVYTTTWVRRRPLLTLMEIVWRWLFGIPAMWAVWYCGTRILAETPWRATGVTQLSIGGMLTDPLGSSVAIAQAMMVLGPPVLHVAMWLAPTLVLVWAVIAAAGRTIILLRMDSALHARPVTLFALNILRLIPMAATAWLWWATLAFVAHRTIRQTDANGDSQVMLYIAVAIALTFALFALWAAVGWIFGMAPILAMLHNAGPMRSLALALRLGAVRNRLIEINLVMGVVKIALLILLLVFSATPLPFQSALTDEFLIEWSVAVGILYFIASDFFHVARIAGYLHLWQEAQIAE